MILTKIIKDEKMSKFWDDLDEMIMRVLFPTPGKGVNWSVARKKQLESKLKKQKSY